MVSPIVNGKFDFKGTFDLGDKKFQYATIIIDKRGNISKEEAASKFDNFIWLSSKAFMRNIILESLKINIEDKQSVANAVIVEKGLLTKNLDSLNDAQRKGNRKLISAIKKYPNSPVSFSRVKDVLSYITLDNAESINSNYGTPIELFNQLSPALRLSKDGLALKKKIDAKNKLNIPKSAAIGSKNYKKQINTDGFRRIRLSADMMDLKDLPYKILITKTDLAGYSEGKDTIQIKTNNLDFNIELPEPQNIFISFYWKDKKVTTTNFIAAAYEYK